MKWNSHPAQPSGDNAEWTAPVQAATSSEDDMMALPPMQRDGYYHVIAANHESRMVTVRALDGAFHFLEALKRQQR